MKKIGFHLQLTSLVVVSVACSNIHLLFTDDRCFHLSLFLVIFLDVSQFKLLSINAVLLIFFSFLSPLLLSCLFSRTFLCLLTKLLFLSLHFSGFKEKQCNYSHRRRTHEIYLTYLYQLLVHTHKSKWQHRWQFLFHQRIL